MTDESNGIEPAIKSRSARTPIIVGVSLLVVAVLGVGAYAGSKLLGGGSQAADALPDSVIAYASIDIDPGAKQKIEAIRTLRKFPSLKEAIKVDENGDIRKRIFDGAISGDTCQGKVSFDQDIAPWLGDRAAVAAVDLGEDEPAPAIALAVKDEGEAKAAIDKLVKCGGDQDLFYAFNEGFMLLSDTKSHASKLVSQAKKATLTDDAEFGDWSDELGGDGIVKFYVSKSAGDMLGDLIPPELAGQTGDAEKALADFEGMAGVLRFADSGLELSMAAKGAEDYLGTDDLGAALTGLPEDTALALALGVPDDFAEKMLDQLTGAFGGEADQFIGQAEAESGLSLPEDLQTLLGDALVLAIGGDAPESLDQVQGPGDVPVGLKIVGDPDKIKALIAKAEERAGQKLSDADIVQDAEGDSFVLASNSDFAKALLGKGALGDNDDFKAVIPKGGDSSFAFYVDFDSNWRDAVLDMVKGVGDEEMVTEVTDNTEPLGAFGISGWRDGKTSHILVKLTTD